MSACESINASTINKENISVNFNRHNGRLKQLNKSGNSLTNFSESDEYLSTNFTKNIRKKGRPTINSSSINVLPSRVALSPINNPASYVVGNRVINAQGNASDKPKTIVVEGNIGSGKSTLLEYFAKTDDVEIFQEPVHKWRDNKGQNMLELMYKDASRWSFAFQSHVQYTMLQVHLAQTARSVKLMERSIHSSKYCFIENLYQSNKLHTAEYNILSEWFDLLAKDIHIDHIVYLRSTPEQCKRRICERNRQEELGIPLKYLQDLHELHENWLVRKTKFHLPAPVLVLDATRPRDEMRNQFECLKQQLL